MASKPHWFALLALVGCDQGSPPEAPRAGAIAVCDDTPFEQMPAKCDGPALLDPLEETVIDPDLTGNPTLRSVDALVHAGGSMAAVGSYGSAVLEGAWWVAIDAAGATQWSGTLAGTGEVTAVFAAGDADGLWVAAAQADNSTIVQHLSPSGEVLGDTVLEDFTATSLLAQTAGVVALIGTNGAAAAYAVVDTDGTELSNGSEDLIPGPHVIANGDVQFFEGPGAPTWTVDPRDDPDPGFPVDVGAERAIITSTGAIVAMGEALGPLGDNMLVVRLDAAGRSAYALRRPRSLGEVVLEGPLDSVVAVGRSFYCRPGTYYVVFDPVGVQVEEGLLPAPPEPWIIDTNTNLASVALEDDVLTLRNFAVTYEVPKR